MTKIVTPAPHVLAAKKHVAKIRKHYEQATKNFGMKHVRAVAFVAETLKLSERTVRKHVG